MKVRVLRDRCVGYTICAELAPLVFLLDESGRAYVNEDPPSDLESLVRKAARMCPQRAIEVTAGEQPEGE